jgi:bacterioferritin (cytochrome b1)
MLLVNTSLVLELPPLDKYLRCERLFESFGRMRIEQRLNRVGRRRLLASSQTTEEEWIDALHEMSSDGTDDDPDAFATKMHFQLVPIEPRSC